MPKRDGSDLLVMAGRNVMRGFVWSALVAGVASPALVASRVQATERTYAEVASLEERAGAQDEGEGANAHESYPASEPGPEDGSGPEDGPEDAEAPVIDVLWGGEPLRDDALLTSPAELYVVVAEQTPLLDDEGQPSYQVTLTHASTGRALELPAWEPTDDPSSWMLAIGGEDESVRLADGSYDVEVSCEDALGHTAREVRHFCLDTQAPVVHVQFAAGSHMRLLSNGCTYAQDPLIVEVEVADHSLSLPETMLLGVPLSDLVEDASSASLPQGVSCGPWTRELAADGTPSLRAALTLAEGTYDLTELVRAQDGAGRATAGGLELQGKPVTTVVVDGTAPTIRVEGTDEGAFAREEITLRVHVHDAHLGAVATLDGDRPLAELVRDGEVVRRLSAGYEGARATDTDHVYTLCVPSAQTHADDGHYELRVQLEDLSGNVSMRVTRSFAVDTTAPELCVTYESEGKEAPSAHPYYRTTRTAHLVVRDAMLDVGDLEGPQSPIQVSVSAGRGRSQDEVEVGAWHRAEDGALVCDVVFLPNGSYELEVSGTDKAGNALVGVAGTEVDERGRYCSERFVVDDLAPAIEVSYKQGTPDPASHDGIDYFRRPTTLVVRASDRNLDLSQSTVTDTRGNPLVPQWRETRREDDGTVCYEAEVAYVEEGGARKHPRVHAVDLAGNELLYRVPPFVVDQTAPSITRVRTSAPPAQEQREHPQDDPTYYYNAGGDASASLAFILYDECGLSRVWLDDPDGTYNLEAQNVHGKTKARFVMRLKDQEGERHDASFERNIRLCVRDLAGNVREWTLDREGRVVTDRAHTTQNISLDDGGVFPQALVLDATSPRVSVSGVEAGTYYDAGQVAHVEVYERLFSHVRRFHAQRLVATVERRDPMPERTLTKWSIRAAEFEGEDPLYRFDQPLMADGHYSITAGFADIAGNVSNTVHVGEFTVDTLAPTIEVTWNNEDVRNGNYYRAERVATVRVVEHNFSPDLVSIETTGSVGAWRTKGDTHTCEVSFSEDSSPEKPHTLAIRAQDLAGNKAQDVEVAPFVIDTTAPTLSVLKRVSGQDAFSAEGDTSPLESATAYAQAFELVVTCADDTSFDASGVEVSLRGARGGTWEPERTVQKNGVTLEWPNIGLTQDGDAPAYLVSADDVYTLTAKVTDLAGNESQEEIVMFSLNRYGSNFYAENIAQGEEASVREGMAPLLAVAPRVVIHEINVSGAAPQGPGDEPSHVVTKEHAHATTEIPRTTKERGSGYLLLSPGQDGGDAPEGWSEYVYAIGPGNFGKGSDTDLGDGGQGLYRVDVSSRDRAQNLNTTAHYWGTGEGHEEKAQTSSATVSFILDEEGPKIEDVTLPEGIYIGDGYKATFRVRDEITNGDTVQVLVDGQKTEVVSEESSEPLDEAGHIAHQGSFSFVVDARPLAQSRDVEIRIADYTGQVARTHMVRRGGIRVSTLVPELSCAVAALVSFVLVRRWVAHRVPPRA